MKSLEINSYCFYFISGESRSTHLSIKLLHNSSTKNSRHARWHRLLHTNTHL